MINVQIWGKQMRIPESFVTCFLIRNPMKMGSKNNEIKKNNESNENDKPYEIYKYDIW